LAAGEPLGDEWTEVLDVVRHHRAEFVGCGLKKGPVAAADEVRAVRDRVDVVAALAQQHSDLRRELLARSASRKQGALSESCSGCAVSFGRTRALSCIAAAARPWPMVWTSSEGPAG